jgi:hypothetical protein
MQTDIMIPTSLIMRQRRHMPLENPIHGLGVANAAH